MPQRIQRKRIKGWKAPEGAVNCTRPSKWSNPWRITERQTRESVLREFRKYAEGRAGEIQADLHGKDLMCFCGLDEDCHVDILLEIANR